MTLKKIQMFWKTKHVRSNYVLVNFYLPSMAEIDKLFVQGFSISIFLSASRALVSIKNIGCFSCSSSKDLFVSMVITFVMDGLSDSLSWTHNKPMLIHFRVSLLFISDSSSVGYISSIALPSAHSSYAWCKLV